MTIVNANYKFIYAHVGSQGRMSDGGVFQRTSFCRSLLNNTLNIPKPIPLKSMDLEVPYVLVADDAFPLTASIMKPFPVDVPPTEEKWREIAINFEKYANFPNCIGAVDGKHIRIVKPINSGSLCYNYKYFFSIVLLAVCDANFCFTYIDVGAFGKFSDSNVFVNSEFWNKLENDLLHIPKERPISGDEEMRSFPYVLVGDEAFKLTPHLMRPYARKNLNHKKKIFNYRLTRARRYIECSFGILSNKWRIFHRPLNVSFRLAKKIIKACCVLHNFVCSRDGYAFHHTLKTKGFRPINPAISVQNRVGYSVRDQFANYFVSPSGQVPWQESRI
nr:unnamed protein product [Callosobruchus analis]